MRTVPCTPGVRSGRLRKAREFLNAAEMLQTLDSATSAIVVLLIDAGIAAADVTCCAKLGKHNKSGNHSDAVTLLKPVDANLSKDLKSLLGLKNKAEYSADQVSASELTAAFRTAQRLVEAAELLGPR